VQPKVDGKHTTSKLEATAIKLTQENMAISAAFIAIEPPVVFGFKPASWTHKCTSLPNLNKIGLRSKVDANFRTLF